MIQGTEPSLLHAEPGASSNAANPTTDGLVCGRNLGEMSMNVIDAIDQKIGEVRTESIDISVGELISLHQQKELEIQPDFQRLFRWTIEQQSRLVESLLLGLPLPSIFVIENASGVFELIDGLQRFSSLLHFVEPISLSASHQTDENDPIDPDKELDPNVDIDAEELGAGVGVSSDGSLGLRLEGCDLVPDLNGLTFSELPLTLRLRLKRTAIRTVVIKRQSSQFLRYEMFKRLNTGGSPLSDQDVRNVNARMLGEHGASFYKNIRDCARNLSFRRTIELLPSTLYENRGDEELVLRFFACKNHRSSFKGNVSEWLDSYMEAVLIQGMPFGADQTEEFNKVFDLLAEKLGPHAFVKYRGGDPVGGVAPAYFEAVSMAALYERDKITKATPEAVKAALAKTVESTEFRKVTGPGANSFPKLERRIEIVRQAFASL